MNRSRKVVVAALVLVGGYGAAWTASKACRMLAPPAADATSQSPPVATAHVQTPSVAGSIVATPSVGQLVPELPGSHSAAAASAVNHPTWLVAVPDVSTPGSTATQPLPIQAPQLASLQTPALPSAAPPDAPASFAAPKAKITNVLSAASEPSPQAASPWDRWPQWNANAAAASGPVASTFQEVSAPPATKAVQVAFNDEITRKNSPPLDRGPRLEATDRTHVVVDGDSLASLADRYLDNPTLGQQIYDLNREVLSNPDLLPIGIELRIPAQPHAAATAAPNSASVAAVGTYPAPPAMVPVEWKPRPFEPAPRAELLRPVLSDAGR